MKSFVATERVGPAKMPISLDVGRLTARDGFQFFALASGALAAGSLGALLVWIAYPSFSSDWSGFRLIIVTFGASIALLGLGLALLTVWFGATDWIAYKYWLADCRELYLTSHDQSGGVEIERTFAGWELTSTHPAHVLAVALAVHQRSLTGELAHSVRALEGPVWLGGVRLGDVTSTEAEALSRKLAALGLIEGRASRSAGKWVPQTPDDIVKRLTDRWSTARGE